MIDERHILLKKNLDLFRSYTSNKGKGGLRFSCQCGLEVSVSGTTSHSKACDKAILSRMNFLIEKFEGRKNCAYCEKEISLISNQIFKITGIDLHFCGSKCRNEARKYVYNIETHGKVCPVCGSDFASKNMICSNDCYKAYLSFKVKEWHHDPTTKDIRKERAERIGKTRKDRRIGVGIPSWNAGLKGKEYLKHFEKEDGTNSLYESLKDNSNFFRKTKLEDAFEVILNELGFRYQHSFFTQGRQFDFLISFENSVIIVETDGDYWHRSSRLGFDLSERTKYRIADKEKELVLKNMKNTNKTWYIIRFWEHDIHNDKEAVVGFLKLLHLKDKTGDINGFKYTISKIKKHYENWA